MYKSKESILKYQILRYTINNRKQAAAASTAGKNRMTATAVKK